MEGANRSRDRSLLNLRQTLFASNYSVLTPVYQAMLRPQKEELFKDFKTSFPSRQDDGLEHIPLFLEVGPGPGTNFDYYPTTPCNLIVIDPNLKFKPLFIQNLKKYPHINLLGYYETGIEGVSRFVKDNSVSAVIGTDVGCSVPNIKEYYDNVLKILRPGGKFYYVEHIRAEEGSLMRLKQRVLRKWWEFQGCGCQIDRELDKEIETAGFSSVDQTIFYVDVSQIPWYWKAFVFGIITRHVKGVATK